MAQNSPKKSVRFALKNQVAYFTEEDSELANDIGALRQTLSAILQMQIGFGIIQSVNNYSRRATNSTNIFEISENTKDLIIYRIRRLTKIDKVLKKAYDNLNEFWNYYFWEILQTQKGRSVSEVLVSRFNEIDDDDDIDIFIVVLLVSLDPTLSLHCKNHCGVLSSDEYPLATKICRDIMQDLKNLLPNKNNARGKSFVEKFDKHFYFCFKCSLIGKSYLTNVV